MTPLRCYTFFHLNLSYSAIERQDHPAVVDRCYWPLLRLIEQDIPIGVELSGQTLCRIAEIDPVWLETFRRLLDNGKTCLIGSGEAQIIGPLVPGIVNRQNLRLGASTYEALLRRRPDIALINEQAYSRSLAAHYLEAGYRAVIMEWNNPRSVHPDWSSEIRYSPCRIHGTGRRPLSLIWNDAIAFQKFQRYAHAELNMDAYLQYLCSHVGEGPRCFPIYGNDAEIFDYRPGRYQTEPLLGDREWDRIAALFRCLVADPRIDLILPNDLLGAPLPEEPLVLETACQPIPVKKQRKYNITRWAVTGRDDLGINTQCHRCLAALEKQAHADDERWRRLIHLWGSDYRTHITEARWQRLLTDLEMLGRDLGLDDALATTDIDPRQAPCRDEGRQPLDSASDSEQGIRILRGPMMLTVETDTLLVVLNMRRGLAFDAIRFKHISDTPLVGTLAHGFFDDIKMGADFYTGHLVYESPGMPKITDLEPMAPSLSHTADGLTITGQLSTEAGMVEKRIHISKRDAVIEQQVELTWPKAPFGSLRIGHITLNPIAFDRQTLFYETHNGGEHPERFEITNRQIDHGAPVSFLVSASHGVGMTAGIFTMGDAHKSVAVTIDRQTAAMLGLVTFKEVGDRYFFRLAPSARELDETAHPSSQHRPYHRRFSFRITAGCVA